MLELFQPPRPGWGELPNMSPFCLKLETYLRMAEIPYKARGGDPRRAPTGKIPYIRDDGKLIGDSGLIIEYLKNKHGDALDSHLSPQEAASMHAMRRMIEEFTFFCMAWSRWTQPDSWAHLQAFFKKLLPPVVGNLIIKAIRNDFKKAVYKQGVGRHSKETIEGFAKSDLKAISDFLGNKKFMMGERPTSLDATAYGFLANILWVPWEEEAKRYAKSLPNLEAYCARMHDTYWKQ